jgi:legumain
MFDNINPDLNVYSVTAASPSEQSLATYCYPQDYVNGQEMHTCLSNEFTSNWLDDSDSRIFFEENQKTNDSICEYSSHEQFLYTKDKTKNSHVQEYGDLSVGDLPITYFQSSKDTVNYNDKYDGRKKEDEKKKEKDEDDIDYEEIKRKIIEFDLDEEDIYFNSYESNENDFD